MGGGLWVGDVGQNAVEEIDVIRRGGNYGWRKMEGTRLYRPGGDLTGLLPPVTEYAHDGGRCSVTGGYVYRADGVPGLRGTYIFGDYCSGEIIGLADGQQAVLLDTGLRIPSFGEDEAGELYVVDRNGAIHRIVPEDQAS